MNKCQNYLAEGFRNVDSQNATDKFKTCLTFLDSIPSVRKYKEETDQMLRPEEGRVFVDIGCGLGFDVERIARKTSARVFGLDASHRLLEEARHRSQTLRLTNAQYVHEDAQSMSFEDNRFDGARVDRVLQHVEDPNRVLKEMARVVRKGGRVVCAEPDWGSFLLDDGDARCVKAVSDEWTASIRNPYIGRELPRMMKLAGLTNVETGGHLLATYGLREVNLVFDLKKTCELLSEKIHSSDFFAWYQDLAFRDSRLPIFAGVTIVIAVGLKG